MYCYFEKKTMDTTASNYQINNKTISDLESVLHKKGFKSIVLNSESEVIDFINKLPNDGIMGLGDSITTCALKIRNLLIKKGSLIFYSWNGADDYNRTIETFEEHPDPDFYLTRINAITTKGDIMVKDYSKKAVADKKFPKHILAFAGYNRIVDAFTEGNSVINYTIFTEKPENIDFTVVLLPFICY
jgi:hypothetical protein